MLTKKSRMIHMRIDVRGALMNWSDSEWRDCVRGNSGKILTPAEVKAGFLDELAEGNLFLPLGDCDNFDPKEGCKGHPVEEENSQSREYCCPECASESGRVWPDDYLREPE
jgi:hypothetical protein